jgi:hypothetical protein
VAERCIDDNPNYRRQSNFNPYVPQNPISAMIEVAQIKQQKYDERYIWIQERINELYNLKNIFFSSENLPPDYDVISTREKYWKYTVDYAESIKEADLADDYIFRSIQTRFDEIEDYYYESINFILAQKRSESTLSSSILNKTIMPTENSYLYYTTFDNPDFEVPLRSGPKMSYPEIYKCPIDEIVYVLDKSDVNYYKVKVNGRIGYIAKGFLTRKQ